MNFVPKIFKILEYCKYTAIHERIDSLLILP